jgi:hypothetical protein
MTKRRLLSSVAAAATMVGACLLLAPAAQAADTCTTSGPLGLPTSCSNSTTTCSISYGKFLFPTVNCGPKH